jgi:hypothetical protein
MSWEQLLHVYKLSAEEARENKSRIPVACPNDGEPLTEGLIGIKFCINDGWQYPRDHYC